jgi:hypothetical protein
MFVLFECSWGPFYRNIGLKLLASWLIPTFVYRTFEHIAFHVTLGRSESAMSLKLRGFGDFGRRVVEEENGSDDEDLPIQRLGADPRRSYNVPSTKPSRSFSSSSMARTPPLGHSEDSVLSAPSAGFRLSSYS